MMEPVLLREAGVADLEVLLPLVRDYHAFEQVDPYAAQALGRSSSLVRQRTEQRPLFMRFLIEASEGRIFPEVGGRLIRDAAGAVIGALGVTGDLETRDEELAAHGIRAAGLKTDEDCAHLGNRVRTQN